MRPIGFSTGAVAKGDFRRALNLLREHHVDVVELSALRVDELEPLVAAIPDLDLGRFSFVSIAQPVQPGIRTVGRWTTGVGCRARLPFSRTSRHHIHSKDVGWAWRKASRREHGQEKTSREKRERIAAVF